MVASMEEIRATETIAVIDGNSLMHRAFHAVPLTMNAPDGRCTNACFGFIAMLLKLVEEFNPNGVICAFDAGRPAFRMEALAQYKAQRPPMDPLLKEQFSMIDDLLDSLNIPVVRIQGWEGDDVLGTLAERGDKQGKHMLLVTGDKDALQLASAHTAIVTTKKGISDVVLYDPAAVFERYGVTPAQVPDFLGLKGDPSDNIPGVPGVGEKTAAKLLQDYGSLEEIYAHKDAIKGKMGENIRENEEAAYNSRKVATIARDIPLELDLDEVRFPDFDPLEVRAAFGKLRFNAHLTKILKLGGGVAGCGSSKNAPVVQRPFLGKAGSDAVAICQPLFADDQAEEFVEDAIASDERLALWVDEGDGPSLFGDTKELYVAGERGVAHFRSEVFQNILAHLVRDADIICLDAKALLGQVFPPDTSLETSITVDELRKARVFDVSLAAYLLNSSRHDYTLEQLLNDYLSESIPPLERNQSEPAVFAACLRSLAAPLFMALEKDGSLSCYEKIELPLLPVLLEMERTGVDLDVDVLAKINESTEADIAGLQTRIYREAGEGFNIDSPKQLGVILFEKLKLPVKKKTKTGYSTDASVLNELKGLHPLPALILEYRELAKIKSTYIDALPRLLGGDKRLHTTFNQTVTATGRLSSSDPNLQNIPVRTDFGRLIRTAFTPKGADEVFLSVDYSQIELRLLAHLSGDKGLIAAFAEGEDFHAATAARVFDVPLDQVDPQMRSRAKAVNFGIVYGQQAFGLSQSLGCSFKEAQDMIDRYFAAYPRVRDYLDETVEFARQNGYVSTMFGRKRHIPEISSHNVNMRNFGERTAMNHPMQGTAADIIKLAMIEVSRKIHEEGLPVRFCLQVHDELDFECAKIDAEHLATLVEKTMESTVKLSVPLEASTAIGENWAAAK